MRGSTQASYCTSIFRVSGDPSVATIICVIGDGSELYECILLSPAPRGAEAKTTNAQPRLSLPGGDGEDGDRHLVSQFLRLQAMVMVAAQSCLSPATRGIDHALLPCTESATPSSGLTF